MRIVRTLPFCAFALLLLPSAGTGQDIGGGGGSQGGRIEGKYQIVPLPYVNYNRSIGASFGALPMVMFNPVMRDTISPSSIGGLVGM